MTLNSLYKFEFSENLSRFHRFRTLQQLNKWREISIVSDNIVSRTNWSNWVCQRQLGFLVLLNGTLVTRYYDNDNNNNNRDNQGS